MTEKRERSGKGQGQLMCVCTHYRCLAAVAAACTVAVSLTLLRIPIQVRSRHQLFGGSRDCQVFVYTSATLDGLQSEWITIVARPRIENWRAPEPQGPQKKTTVPGPHRVPYPQAVVRGHRSVQLGRRRVKAAQLPCSQLSHGRPQVVA